MNRLLGNSAMPNYVKLLAAGMLTATYLCALGIGTYDMAISAAVPTPVALIIGTGLGVAQSVLGIHQGASLTENTGGLNASTPPA